jgi:hypothetical protein
VTEKGTKAAFELGRKERSPEGPNTKKKDSQSKKIFESDGNEKQKVWKRLIKLGNKGQIIVSQSLW